MQQGGAPFRVPAAGVVPVLACAVILWLLSSIQPLEWAVVAAVLAAASALFFLTRGRRALQRA